MQPTTDTPTPTPVPVATSTPPTAKDVIAMTEQTLQIVVIIFCGILGLIALGGAAVMGYILLRDGNTPLVTDVAGKFTMMILGIVASITIMVTGRSVISNFMKKFTDSTS